MVFGAEALSLPPPPPTHTPDFQGSTLLGIVVDLFNNRAENFRILFHTQWSSIPPPSPDTHYKLCLCTFYYAYRVIIFRSGSEQVHN